MPLKTTRFDAADYIETPADVAGFLALAFADNDPDEIRDAIAVVARSRGMATLAAKAKLNPKSLYRTLGPNGNPEFATCSASSRRSASRSRQPSSHHARAPRAKPRDRRAKFAKFWQIVHTTGPCAALTPSTAAQTAPRLADARAVLSDRATVARSPDLFSVDRSASRRRSHFSLRPVHRGPTRASLTLALLSPTILPWNAPRLADARASLSDHSTVERSAPR